MPGINAFQDPIAIYEAKQNWNIRHPENPVTDLDARAKTRYAWSRVFLVNNPDGTIQFKELNLIQRIIRKLLGDRFSPHTVADTIFKNPADKQKIAKVFAKNVSKPFEAPQPAPLQQAAASSSSSSSKVAPVSSDSPRELSTEKLQDQTIKGIELYVEDLVQQTQQLEFQSLRDVVDLTEYTQIVRLLLEDQFKELGYTQVFGEDQFEDLKTPLTDDQKNKLKEIRGKLLGVKENLVTLVEKEKDLIKTLCYAEAKQAEDQLTPQTYRMLTHAYECLVRDYNLELDKLPKLPPNATPSPRTTNQPPKLPNLGNSCYMNSSLQALLVTMNKLTPLIYQPLVKGPGETSENFGIRQKVQNALKQAVELSNNNAPRDKIRRQMIDLRINLALLIQDIRGNIEGQHTPDGVLTAVLDALNLSIPLKITNYKVEANGNISNSSIKDSPTTILSLGVVLGKPLDLNTMIENAFKPTDLPAETIGYNKAQMEFTGAPLILPILIKRVQQPNYAEYQQFLNSEIEKIKMANGGQDFSDMKAAIRAQLVSDYQKLNKVVSEEEIDRKVENNVLKALTIQINKENGFKVLPPETYSMPNNLKQAEYIERIIAADAVSKEAAEAKVKAYMDDKTLPKPRLSYVYREVQQYNREPVILPEKDILTLNIAGEKVKYRLKCTINHHGRSSSGGHYTAHVKDGDNYYHCNDEVITAESREDSQMEQGYMFMFEKI